MKLIKSSHTIILVISLVFLALLIKFRWNGNDGENLRSVIGSDGVGYYEYLPYFFIDDYPENRKINHLFHVKQNGKYVNKYYVGTAIAQSPFFFGAYAWCKISGNKCDGFSTPFQLAISISGWVYFVLILLILQKLLIRHFHFSGGITSLTLLVFSFGSMLLYYVVICGSFSHVYSVFFSTLFFWQISTIARKQFSMVGLILLMLALSMVVVIRPVNILLILFVPFFFKNFQEMKGEFKCIFQLKSHGFWVAIGIAFIPVLVQLYAWYAQCGSVFVWSYANEGFYFTHPQVLNFLFSYRKGLFIYSPLLLISILGLFHLWKFDRWKFYWALISLSVIVYVLSSWWCWHYAGGFGLRPMVDYSIIFILLFAFLLNSLKTKITRAIAGIVVALAVFFNVVFSFQFYKGIIKPTTMDKTKFWYAFLRTNQSFVNCFGGINDTRPYAPRGFTRVFKSYETFNLLPNGVLNSIDSEFPFEPIRIGRIQNGKVKGNCFVRIVLKRKINAPDAGNNILWIVATENANGSLNRVYESFRIKECRLEEANKWINSTYTISFFNHELDSVPFHVFIHNPLKEEMLLDDVLIEVYVAK